MDLIRTYGSHALTGDELREAAARAAVLADASAAAFVDRSMWRSAPDLRPLAAGLSREIARCAGLHGGSDARANGRDKQRRKASSMKRQPRLRAARPKAA